MPELNAKNELNYTTERAVLSGQPQPQLIVGR